MRIKTFILCYLLALISSIVGCVDAKQPHKLRRGGRYVKLDVNGVGTTERSVVSQSLESNHSVLQETEAKVIWITAKLIRHNSTQKQNVLLKRQDG